MYFQEILNTTTLTLKRKIRPNVFMMFGFLNKPAVSKTLMKRSDYYLNHYFAKDIGGQG